MSKIRWPRNGEEVKFQHGDEVLVGICNGDPASFDNDGTLTHLPVHIPVENENVMVYAKNIIEWPD